jgi:hypothetical protein
MNHRRSAALALLVPSILSLLGLPDSFGAETPLVLTNSAKPHLSVAVFDIDATPPVGSMMAYDPVTNKWDLGLRARGIVLLGADQPVVLCAIDWIGIANEAHDAFRASLAEAAGTSPERVAVHTLHQHDAPDCDFSAERLLKEVNLDPRQFESSFQKQTLNELARAVRNSLERAQPITQLGLGDALHKLPGSGVAGRTRRHH